MISEDTQLPRSHVSPGWGVRATSAMCLVVNALRAVTGPEYQQFITDLFERIVLYDLRVDAARARQIAGGYEVTIEVIMRQFKADAHGKETEEPLDTWFNVAVFAEIDKPLEGISPLYIEKHRPQSGKQVLTVHTSKRPGIVVLAPFHKRIQRSGRNNSQIVVKAKRYVAEPKSLKL